MAHGVEFVFPIGHGPMKQIDAAAGVIAGRGLDRLHSGNFLRPTLNLFRGWKIVGSVLADGSGNKSPPLFWCKSPGTFLLTSINKSKPKRSAFAPTPELGVFSEAGKCFCERFRHCFTCWPPTEALSDHYTIHRHESGKTLGRIHLARPNTLD